MGKQKEAMKTAIKDEFLERMRQAAAEGRKPELEPGWLYGEFLPSLSPAEERALEEVLAEMIHQGIIVKTEGRRPTYRLTRHGAEILC